MVGASVCAAAVRITTLCAAALCAAARTEAYAAARIMRVEVVTAYGGAVAPVGSQALCSALLNALLHRHEGVGEKRWITLGQRKNSIA